MLKAPRLSHLAIAVVAALACMQTSFADERSTAEVISDARHEAQIWTTYSFNPHLKALDISVEVRGDTATLAGTVENAVEKDLATQIALGTSGIKNVNNNLVVQSGYVPKKAANASGDRAFSTVVADATITASVKSKLLWNSHTDGLSINVDTMNGAVKLTGTADTAVAKDLAGELAANTYDVRSVDNQLGVDPKAARNSIAAETNDIWITSKVMSTFAMSRSVHALDIKVNTEAGVVTLAGKVENSAERELAIRLAKNIRGVKEVRASALNAT